MKGLRLYKAEKLCSRTAVSLLFEQGHSSIAYPLRMVYRLREPGKESPAQFMITIPKKKIRHAVGRVLLRRRIREVYRLWRRTLLHPALQQAGQGVDVAFIYLDKELSSYEVIQQSVKTLLSRLGDAVQAKSEPTA